jgi:hypothetical protein
MSKRTEAIPDIKEFIDDAGKKWIQTSTDDLFSLGELNDIFEKIEKEKDTGEVVLARIDFQKVNREYYDAALNLQKKLLTQQDLLKKIAHSSKAAIDKKNAKLKELIEYIKKLHTFITYISTQKNLENIEMPTNLIFQAPHDEEIVKAVYMDVEERVMDPDENE